METNKKDYKAFFHTDSVVKKDGTLTDISKLIFSDITYFMFLRDGKCKASNGYFANRYGKSNGTVSKAISALFDAGYIKRFIDEYRNRTIYVRRSKFAKDQDNTGAIDKDGDIHDQSKNGKDQPLSSGKPSTGATKEAGKYTESDYSEMEDLINKTLENE